MYLVAAVVSTKRRFFTYIYIYLGKVLAFFLQHPGLWPRSSHVPDRRPNRWKVEELKYPGYSCALCQHLPAAYIPLLSAVIPCQFPNSGSAYTALKKRMQSYSPNDVMGCFGASMTGKLPQGPTRLHSQYGKRPSDRIVFSNRSDQLNISFSVRHCFFLSLSLSALSPSQSPSVRWWIKWLTSFCFKMSWWLCS